MRPGTDDNKVQPQTDDNKMVSRNVATCLAGRQPTAAATAVVHLAAACICTGFQALLLPLSLFEICGPMIRCGRGTFAWHGSGADAACLPVQARPAHPGVWVLNHYVWWADSGAWAMAAVACCRLFGAWAMGAVACCSLFPLVAVFPTRVRNGW